MSNLSAIIIVKNGEEMIEDCISSVKFCDEIVVVDSGSTDKTIEIAQKNGAKVFRIDTSDFSKLRNFGKEYAKGEWIFYVDADEKVTPELAKDIRNRIEEENQYGAFRIKRKNYYLGNHEWPGSELLERVFKKEALKQWYGSLHESAQVEGSIGILDGYLLHYSHRNLSLMLKKTIVWSSVEANLRFESHHPAMTWWRFFRVMITGFCNSFFVQKGYTVGIVGLIESMYQSFSLFITYAKLWELQKNQKTK